MTAPETMATEATEAPTMTLTATRDAITDASQVVMDAYDVGLLIEILLDDLCQHRLSYEESPDAIDKEYLHIGEVCEHVTRLTQIMRAYGAAEKARGWTSEVGRKAAGAGTTDAVGAVSAATDTGASPGAGTDTEGPERATGRAARRGDANGKPPAINPW